MTGANQYCISVFPTQSQRKSSFWVLGLVVFCVISTLFSVEAKAGGKEKKADSLKAVLATQKDTSRVLTLVKLAQAMLPINKDSALFYGIMLKREAEAWGKPERICDAYVVLGTCYHRLQIEDSAMLYKRRALKVGVDSKYSKGEANASNDIGLYLKEKGDLDSAIYYILRATELREKNKDEKALGTSYTNLALLYYTQDDFLKSMDYYRRAEKVFAKFGQDEQRALVVNNLAAIYDEGKQYDSSLYYYQIALDLRDSLGDPEGVSQTMINMGVTYRHMGQFEKAEALFLKAVEIKKEIKDTGGEATACLDLAENARLMKKYDMSEKYIVRADTLANQIEQKELLRDVYKVYADLYSETGRPALALEYYKKYQVLSTEILGEEKFRTMQELQTRYETEKKERENVQLREQTRLNEEALQKDKLQKRLLLGGVGVLLLILGLSFYAYRTKTKTNALLASKNEQISKQNSVLKELNKKLIDSEEELTAINATKDKLFSIISHDLGNPVNALLNYNNVVRGQKDAMSKEDLATSLDKINLTLQPLQGLLENLLHWSIQQQSGTIVRREKFSADDVIRETIELYAGSATVKGIATDLKIDNNLVIESDRNMMQLIFRNLYANAVKFSPVGKPIKIAAKKLNTSFVLEIFNDGAGMDQMMIDGILLGNKIGSKKGTNHETGIGIGLSLVTEYLKILGGDLEIESEKGNGVLFRVSVPC